MVDPVTSEVLIGVAGNLASTVILNNTQPIRDTKIGRALSRAGLLKPGFSQLVEKALGDATSSYLRKNASFHISEIYSFLSSKSLASELGQYIFEGKTFDIDRLAEKLSTYVGVPVADAPSHWPNNIDPRMFIFGLLDEFTKALSDASDNSSIWLSRMLVDQNSKLDIISSAINSLQSSISSELNKAQRISRNEEDLEFERLYKAHLTNRFSKVTTPGARELHGLHQSLSVAYISLNIKAGVGAQPSRAEHFLSQNPLVAIRGPAGSGKTTLLNWIITRSDPNVGGQAEWTNTVPFFVPLRKVARVEAGPPVISKLIDYSVDEKLWTQSTPKGWLDQVLRKEKRAVIMIDGVDELPGSRRSDFWDWVDSIINEYPGNRIIITSRALPGSPIDGSPTEQWRPPAGFVEAQLQDMSDADVTQFVHHWHDAVDRSKLDEQEKLGLDEARATLPAKLEDAANRRIRELCATPLLCAMVCVLHWREEGYLPRYRVDLYDKCCDMLIEARDLKRGVQAPPGPLAALSKNDKEMVLQRLAIEMMNNRPDGGIAADDTYRIEISREKAIAWIQPKIASFQAAAAREATAPQVLDFLVERTGLLREPATDLIDFPHRTFQEYLAACAAGAESQEEMLARQADDDQWHETIMLAAGTTTGGVAFGRNLIDALIRRGQRHKSPRKRQQKTRKTSFALALGCLENLKQQDPVLRERVLSNLGELVPPRSEGDARILAVAGDAAVSHLAYQTWKDENTATVAACARALRLIGTTEAMKALERGYVQEQREAVIAEVCRSGCFSYEMIPLVRAYTSEHGELPSFAPDNDISLIANLPGIRELHVDAPETKSLPKLAELKDLRSLILERAEPQDVALSELPEEIEDLAIINGPDTVGPWLNRLKALKRLAVLGGPQTDALGFVDDGARVKQLSISGHCTLSLSGISKMSCLQQLALSELPRLSDIEEIQALPDLKDLYIEGCRKVEDVYLISKMTKLQRVSIGNTAENMKALTAFESGSMLSHLRVYNLPLESLEIVSNCPAIESLAAWSCKLSTESMNLDNNQRLKELDLGNIALNAPLNLGRLSKLSSLRLVSIAAANKETIAELSSSLTNLTIDRCPKFGGAMPLAHLPFLNRLTISNLPKVDDLNEISSLSNLLYLGLENCDSVDTLEWLRDLSIEELHLNNMDSITDFDAVGSLRSLKTIRFTNCVGLKDISFLSKLPELEKIWVTTDRDKLVVPEHLQPKVIHSPSHHRIWMHRTSIWPSPERYYLSDGLVPYVIRRSYRYRGMRRHGNPWFGEDSFT